MKPRNLLVAAVLLAALSGVVWWSKKHPPNSGSTSTSTSPKLVDIAPAAVQSIELAKKASPAITLQHQNGSWKITAPEQVPADQDAVSSLVSSLNPLTADSVVENNATDMARY